MLSSRGTVTAPAPIPLRSVPADDACPFVALPQPFASIPRLEWERLHALTPAATPFSRWTFHRAWWDGYGGSAHEQYLAVVARDDPERLRGIVPLMHRHEVEATDSATASTLRHGPAAPLTGVPPTAKAVFFAASYHADYATVLSAPDDLPGVARALVATLAGPPEPSHGSEPWEIVDLRRLRADDPAADALEAAFRAVVDDAGWCLLREREDVCPTVELPVGADWDGFLAALGKKERHEVRRKLRRAEAAGEVRLAFVADPAAAVDGFIALHQARWGADGLFPDSEGGRRSRRFLESLAALEGPGGALEIGFVTVGGRRVAAVAGFDDGTTISYYNAGADPAARDLSPGVLAVSLYLQAALARGRRAFDFLRGQEPYKYEWGARDVPVDRLLVWRTVGQGPDGGGDGR